jgi:glyoxylase-like metal-dependent hydrolase (beta-lactamase superfamily II)
MAELKRSFSWILSLPPETKIFPGHGPLTTVKREKEFNFFVHEL